MEGRASIGQAEGEVKTLDRELDRLMKLILASDDDDAPVRMMKPMKVRVTYVELVRQNETELLVL